MYYNDGQAVVDSIIIRFHISFTKQYQLSYHDLHILFLDEIEPSDSKTGLTINLTGH